MLSSVFAIFLLSMLYLAKANAKDPTPKSSKIRVVGSMVFPPAYLIATVRQLASFAGVFRFFLFSTLMVVHLFHDFI